MARDVGRGVYSLDVGLDLRVYECGTCGVMYALGEGFDRARRNDHQTFYCPNGHSKAFSDESEEERLTRERNEARDRAARERSLRDQTEASLRATKGVVTKQRKKLDRVKHGVCPCCNRHFENVEAHMATEHPDFDPAALEVDARAARRG
jgi:hypothetical protein